MFIVQQHDCYKRRVYVSTLFKYPTLRNCLLQQKCVIVFNLLQLRLQSCLDTNPELAERLVSAEAEKNADRETNWVGIHKHYCCCMIIYC